MILQMVELGNDIIYGDDTLVGGFGDDTFIEGLDGNDKINGGDGSDTVDYSSIVTVGDKTKNGIVVNLDNSVATVTITDGITTYKDELTSIENIIGTQNNDTITASSSSVNELSGEAGDDIFYETALGLAGDKIDGGDDNDTVDYHLLNSGISVTLNSSTYATVTVSTTHTIKNIENIVGTSSKDIIVGDSENNNIFAGANDDTIGGGTGTNILDGGDGKDTLSYAYEGVNNVSLTINLHDGTVSGTNISDTVKNIENVIAGNKDDMIVMASEAYKKRYKNL